MIVVDIIDTVRCGYYILIVYIIGSCQLIIPMYVALHEMMGMIRKGKT